MSPGSILTTQYITLLQPSSGIIRFMNEELRNLIIFVLVLGGLIFFHELGHFLVAVRVGIKVKEFGLGFPPRLLKFAEWRGTEFTLNAIPFGGFVRPVGEDDPHIIGGLAAAPKRHRVAMLAAGSTMNVLVAFVVLVLGFTTAWPDRVAIMEVASGSPAVGAGVRAGDVVVSANGVQIHAPAQLAQITWEHLGETVMLEVDRDGERFVSYVVPRTQWPKDQGPMGITMTWEIATYSLPQALVRAAQEIGFQAREMLLLPVRLITREVTSDEVRFVSPVGLKTINDQAVAVALELGAMFPVLQVIAVVSMALALTNLLPLPALDGGRILFVVIEAIRGRRIAPEREGLVHFVGMAMLLGLMTVLVVQDLVDPVFPVR